MMSRELQYSSRAGMGILKTVADVIDGYLNPPTHDPTVRWTLTIEDTRTHTADSVTNEKKLAPQIRPGTIEISDDDPRLQDVPIVSRLSMTDGGTEIQLACGHRSLQIIPLPVDCTKMRCAQCINALVDELRAHKEGL